MPAEPTPPLPESPAAFLARVRTQSCYQSLRLVVNLVAVLGWVATFVQASAGLLLIMGSARSTALDSRPSLFSRLAANPLEAEFTTGILAILAALVLALLVDAWRQSQLLKADMADVLIEASRTKGSDGRSLLALAAADRGGSILPWFLLALLIVVVVVWLLGR